MIRADRLCLSSKEPQQLGKFQFWCYLSSTICNNFCLVGSIAVACFFEKIAFQVVALITLIQVWGFLYWKTKHLQLSQVAMNVYEIKSTHIFKIMLCNWLIYYNFILRNKMYDNKRSLKQNEKQLERIRTLRIWNIWTIVFWKERKYI